MTRPGSLLSVAKVARTHPLIATSQAPAAVTGGRVDFDLTDNALPQAYLFAHFKF